MPNGTMHQCGDAGYLHAASWLSLGLQMHTCIWFTPTCRGVLQTSAPSLATSGGGGQGRHKRRPSSAAASPHGMTKSIAGLPPAQLDVMFAMQQVGLHVDAGLASASS